MKTLIQISVKILILFILLMDNQKSFAQSVLITPSKSTVSDTLSIQKKLVVGAKFTLKASNKFEVHANNKVRLSIDDAGKVGVGTSIPQNTLHVEGRTQIKGKLFINTQNGMPNTPYSNLSFAQVTSVSESQDSSDIVLVLYENSGYSPWLQFGKARGTVANPANIQQDDYLFKIVGSAYSNNDFYESGGVELFIDGVPTSTSIPTAMRFNTAREGSKGSSGAMIIRNTGYVGIGTETPEEQLSVYEGINLDQANISDGNLVNALRFGSSSGEGIASKRTEGGNQNGLDFYTNYLNRLTITNDGSVGIGTTTPTQAKLVVNGNVNGSVGNFAYFRNASPLTGTNTTGNNYNYSIYASHRIAATEFNAFSDARIKDIKGISNNEKDLETLSKIEITDYQFKDKIGKGNGQYKKVIAQQVESIYPQAVSKLTDCIPDIYQLTKIENNFISLPNHNLKVGEKVKLIFDEKQQIVEVKEVNEKGLQIVNPQSSIVNQSIFVYGREVSDFRSVDYEALSTLNISATQALLKRLNEAENRINKLEKIQTEILQQIGQMSALNK